MSLAAPWALFGLILLPILWHILRRRTEPPAFVLPTLMFLVEEERAADEPRHHRIKLDAVLALVALGLLVLAAAAPEFHVGTAGREVRIVVSGGAPGTAAGYGERVAAVVAGVRGSLDAGDRLDVVWEPAGDPDPRAPRPDVDQLLGAARQGTAGLRIIVSDRTPSRVPADVRWVGVGDPQAVNVGIAAATIVPQDFGHGLFITVVNDRPRAVDTEITSDGATTRLGVPARGLASTTIPLVADVREAAVSLATPPGDALAADDVVTVTRAPLAVHMSGLPAAHRRVVEDALTAVLGATGYVLAPTPGPGTLVIAEDLGAPHPLLVLGVVAEGEGLRPGELEPMVGTHALAKDLTVDGVDWVFPRDPVACGPDDPQRVVIVGAAPGHPIIATCRNRETPVIFEADPTVGNPAPAETPFWPLFFDNLIRDRFPDRGVRVHGLLDPEASMLGRDVSSFDAAWLAAAPRVAATQAIALRVWLIAAGVLLLLVLWLLPLFRAGLEQVPALDRG